ncbi:MAG: DUF3857 and transglutaminase domain-containing protein [Saprospiraceae bacterium]|nr:DUF3857 and transglutaminase domain-containing protein [Saprospiraceae bacterium]
MTYASLTGALRLVLLLYLPFSLFSQKAPKFGKISPEELSLKACPFDASATAFYLFDNGETQLEGGAVIRLVTRRHFRVKVLQQEGAALADQKIVVYTPERDAETIEDLKAVAYNLENGKVVETKLDKSAIFKEKTSETLTTYKFAVPNVRAGTVFEVSYELRSSYYISIDPWIFQHDYPVQRSEYQVNIFQDFNYRRSLMGYHPVDVKEERGIRRMPMGSGMAELTEIIQNYTAVNVPAFRIEPYLYTDDNYRTAVRFDLKSVDPSNGFTVKVATDWGEVAGNLATNTHFGDFLKKKSPMKDQAATFKAIADPKQLMQQVFSHVQSYYSWNGDFSYLADEAPDEVYKSKKGNSAAINLSLVSLLREVGLDANPVVLSTRNNGRILPGQCSANLLDHTIAVAKIDTTLYYMDASDAFSSVNLLPPQNCNGTAIIVRKETYQAVELKQNQINGIHSHLNLTLDASGNVQGDGDLTFNDYGAWAKRWEIARAGSEKAFLEAWAGDKSGIEFSKSTIAPLDSNDMPLKIQLQGSFNGIVEQAGNLLLVSPWALDQEKENPFTSATRDYPVEFYYPTVKSSTVKLTIPQGYVVESLPKSLKVRLPDGSARFTCNVGQKDNVITLTSMVTVTRTLYTPEEYADLKSFYQTVVDKELEKIVLKKA